MDENNEELIEIRADENAVDFIEDEFKDASVDEIKQRIEQNEKELNRKELNTKEDSDDEEFTEEDFESVGEGDGGNVPEPAETVNSESSDFVEEDDYEADIEALAREEADEEMFKNLSSSITMQTELELVTRETDKDVNPLDENYGDFAIVPYEEKKTFKDKLLLLWNNFLHWKYRFFAVPAILLLVLFVIGSIYLVKKAKSDVIKDTSEYIADNVNYVDSKPEITPPVIVINDVTPVVTPEITEEPEVTEEPEPTEVPTETPTPTPEPEKAVVNIVLLGEENIDGFAGRGRTDLVDILTINSENNSISVTSVLRDCLVSIPGRAENKINAVYALGGPSLVMDTFEANFKFRPDNYILVNFEGFETLINGIDGIDIELTAEEARYLNKTNYISKPEYRNVKEGMNHLNGNQALGYCRIRKVGTKNNEYSDFGRSARHRTVLKAIFSKMVSLDFTRLKSLADSFLPYITTDLDAEKIEMYINKLLNVGVKSLKEYRIPLDGSYVTADLRDMKVTKFNVDKNVEFLLDIVLEKGKNND